MKILSLDPGYERLGVAVLEKNLGDKKEKLLFSECFQTSKRIPHHERLALLGKELERVIEEYRPEILALETLFFSKNQTTAMQVAEARGTILYIASRAGLRVFEYAPNQIKVAVAGHGGADKKQMIAMVPRLVLIDKKIEFDDEFDAIAVGLTCIASEKNLLG